MDKTLKDYASENGMTYNAAWRKAKKGLIPNAKNTSVGWIVETQSDSPKTQVFKGFAEPVEISFAATRSNQSAVTEPVGRFNNIDSGLTPFTHKTYGGGCFVSIREAIELTQKAYYNFAIFRNTIDLMTEFATTNIYFVEGSSQSREFFEAIFNKVNIRNLQDQFYRELFRSSNPFLYRIDSKIRESDVKEITKTYSLAKKEISLPAKYIVLNPADILISQGSSLIGMCYYKLLNQYEAQALQKVALSKDKSQLPQQDVSLYEALPADIKKLVKSGAGDILMPIDIGKVYYIPYKKQDYEPFAVPMGYGVLDDLNRKEELKKMDSQICRTMQQCVLHAKVGFENKNGDYIVDPKNITNLQSIFQNQSVGRVLVTDFATELSFVIPQIGDILDPKKYQILDKDIAIGLNNIIGGSSDGEKFANKSLQVDIFIERLKQARETFISQFLQPEIIRISKNLGFKNFPTAKAEDFKLKDEIDYARIYTRLAELGILTPNETITAIKSGRLPSNEESLEAQKQLKDYKKDDLYEPIIGNKTEEGAKEGGRPPGSSSPKTVKKVSPVGGGITYSAKKLTEMLHKASSLQSKIEKKLAKDGSLNEEQKELAAQLGQIIMANENIGDWENKIEQYIKSPFDTNKERVGDIHSIAYEHQLNDFQATLLYWSKNA